MAPSLQEQIDKTFQEATDATYSALEALRRVRWILGSTHPSLAGRVGRVEEESVALWSSLRMTTIESVVESLTRTSVLLQDALKLVPREIALGAPSPDAFEPAESGPRGPRRGMGKRPDERPRQLSRTPLASLST